MKSCETCLISLFPGKFFHILVAMRHLISLKEQSREDLLLLLQLALKIKAKWRRGEPTDYLPGRTLIMLFEKTSTRTRLSFETAMTQLGGHAIYLDARTTQLTIGADFGDEIQAIMRYGDLLMYRAVKAESVLQAASYNRIPVIDACSEKYHPCQALGDILTMLESAGSLQKISKVAWLGIENNVSNTLKLACAKLGIPITLISPLAPTVHLDPDLNRLAEQSGCVQKTTNLKTGLAGAQFVHTDSWLNMEYFADGKIKPEFAREYRRRIKLFRPYQLNAGLLKQYAPQAKIMHCMPCHLGYEITRDAVDHPGSLIFTQAENRLHIQKAILLWLLGKVS